MLSLPVSDRLMVQPYVISACFGAVQIYLIAFAPRVRVNRRRIRCERSVTFFLLSRPVLSPHALAAEE